MDPDELEAEEFPQDTETEEVDDFDLNAAPDMELDEA